MRALRTVLVAVVLVLPSSVSGQCGDAPASADPARRAVARTARGGGGRRRVAKRAVRPKRVPVCRPAQESALLGAPDGRALMELIRSPLSAPQVAGQVESRMSMVVAEPAVADVAGEGIAAVPSAWSWQAVLLTVGQGATLLAIGELVAALRGERATAGAGAVGAASGEGALPGGEPSGGGASSGAGGSTGGASGGGGTAEPGAGGSAGGASSTGGAGGPGGAGSTGSTGSTEGPGGVGGAGGTEGSGAQGGSESGTGSPVSPLPTPPSPTSPVPRPSAPLPGGAPAPSGLTPVGAADAIPTSTVPEPGTTALLTGGLAALAVLSAARRRRLDSTA